jgi:hypothetical protein
MFNLFKLQKFMELVKLGSVNPIPYANINTLTCHLECICQ